MTKTELERTITEINYKLDDGIKLYLYDRTKQDCIINGIVTGITFVVVHFIFTEIKNLYVRNRNREWYKKHKEEGK